MNDDVLNQLYFATMMPPSYHKIRILQESWMENW